MIEVVGISEATGPCEAVDIVPTADDARFVTCGRLGVKITEDTGFGRMRVRFVCRAHGYEPSAFRA